MTSAYETAVGVSSTDGRNLNHVSVSDTTPYGAFSSSEVGNWWDTLTIDPEHVTAYEHYELDLENLPVDDLDAILDAAADAGIDPRRLSPEHPISKLTNHRDACANDHAAYTAEIGRLRARDDHAREYNSPEAVAARLEAAHGRSVATATDKLRTHNAAKEKVRQEDAAKRRGNAPRARPVSLGDALAEGVPPTRWIVEGLLKGDSTCLLSGPFKAGKSAVTASLVRSLVDGDRYLGHFPVTPTAGTVMVVDTEQGMAELLEVYGSQKIRNVDRVHLVSTDGLASDWDLTLDENMDAAVSMCQDNGVTVLVFDPLSPLFVAMGLDENDSSAQAPLVRFSELKRRAGLDAVVISHHSGYGGGGRARGSSSLPGWAAALWNITRDGDKLDSVRYFDAYGRGINVPAGALSFGLDGRLQFLPASEAAQARRLSTEELKDAGHRLWVERYVDAEPGRAASFYTAKLGDGTAVRGIQVPLESGGTSLVSITKNGIETTVPAMLADGVLSNRGTDKRRELFVVPLGERPAVDPIARPSDAPSNPFTAPAEAVERVDPTPNCAPFDTVDDQLARPGV